ncbi:hypothetical protein NPIL_347211, partial [Nephila pilipes]
SGENLDKVLTQMGDIPLFKLPASEKELDQLVENYKNPAKHQEEAVPKVIVTPLRQDRPESASQAKKPTKTVRDSEGFISPPKHLTRKAPKANPNAQIATTMNFDANPDVDINTLDPVRQTPNQKTATAASPPRHLWVSEGRGSCSSEPPSKMDAQNNWSDRTEFAMEQNDINTANNIDQGAAITASPASRVFDEDFFKQNFSTTRRAIQGRNAYAAWARKLGLTKKDDPEFLRIHEELRRAGENLDKVLANLGDIPLFKLPASEKELDAMIQKPKATAPSQVKVALPIAVSPPSQDRSDSASQGKKSNKRTRDSEGFISPPKHLTRKAPKAINNQEQIDDAPTPDPDVD